MAAAITVTPSTPQAGITITTIAGTGFTAGQVLSVEIISPQYGSNWVLPDGTNETGARMERQVLVDASGGWAFNTPWGFDLLQTYTIKARPVAEQALTTTPIATATVSPTQNQT